MKCRKDYKKLENNFVVIPYKIYIMKTFLQIAIAFHLMVCLQSKIFSQVTYPCGVYYKELNGTTDLGAWSKVYPTTNYTLAAWVQITDPVWQGKEMDIFQREVRGFGDNDGLYLYLSTSGEFKFRAYVFENGIPTLDSV